MNYNNENSEETKNNLYIPVNIKTRFEFIAGFGFAELAITSFVTAVSIIAAVIISAFTNRFLHGHTYSLNNSSSNWHSS